MDRENAKANQTSGQHKIVKLPESDISIEQIEDSMQEKENELHERSSKPKTNSIIIEANSNSNGPKYDIDFSGVKSQFYDIITDRKNVLQAVKINHHKFIKAINQLGIYKYSIDKDFIFILVSNGIIEEISVCEIQDIFMAYIESLPSEINDKEHTFNKNKLFDDLAVKKGILFSKGKLSLLPNAVININTDTKEKAFVYYRNGYVECTSVGYKLLDYNSLKGNIWRSQIMDREFTSMSLKTIEKMLIEKIEVAKFYYLIANKDEKRLSAICSYAGYLMHNYFDTELKVLLLTDSQLSDVAEGRTGKGLFVKTLSYVRNIVDIDGKSFKLDDKHKYQNVDLSTQIVHLEDTKNHFDIEYIFNGITGGVKVEPKGKVSFYVKAKMVLSCNKTINIQGSSARGRTIEFELSEYFSDVYTPEMEFKHRFFSSWTENNEWVNYDNFMMLCLSHYLKNGIIKAEEINLGKRKIRDNTCMEFAEWINEREIDFNKEYDRQVWKNEFLEEYTDLKTEKTKITSQIFTKWLKTYASASGLKYHDRRSNGKTLFRIF